jgi:hypothetical protein
MGATGQPWLPGAAATLTSVRQIPCPAVQLGRQAALSRAAGRSYVSAVCMCTALTWTVLQDAALLDTFNGATWGSCWDP